MVKSTTRIRPVVSAVFLASMLAACEPGGTESQESLRAEKAAVPSPAEQIAERVAGYLAAIKDRDVRATGDYWTEDARLIGPGFELDRTSALDGMRSVFDAGTRVDVLDRRTIELFVHGDTAYEIAKAVEVFVSAGGTPPDTARNNMFIRWERGSDSNWRFDRVLLSPQAGPK